MVKIVDTLLLIELNEDAIAATKAAKAIVEAEEFRQVRAKAREEILRLAGELRKGNFSVAPIDAEPEQSVDTEGALSGGRRDSDAALYVAKQDGRDRVRTAAA